MNERDFLADVFQQQLAGIEKIVFVILLVRKSVV
jgi:hypothetical protein